MATASVTLAVIGNAGLLSQTSITIPVGGIAQLDVGAKDTNGQPSGAPVNVSSGNTSIAKVNSASNIGAAPIGVVGVAPGTVTITATASDNANAIATITVTVA